MAFNSADIGAFKNVWVFCEQRQGKMMPTTFELISEGRKLADELGVELCGILLGDNVDAIAPELGEYGADKVYVYNSPLLKDYTTDAYTKVISDAVEDIKPEILLFGASNIGRDLAPRCAARLHTGLCADCTHLDIDMEVIAAIKLLVLFDNAIITRRLFRVIGVSVPLSRHFSATHQRRLQSVSIDSIAEEKSDFQ